jgi:hypothetical protein
MSNYRNAEREFRPLGFTTRTINALCNAGIYTLQDLGRLTERDVARFSGLGPASISQLRIYLSQQGPSSEIHTRERTISVRLFPDTLTALDAWACENGGKISYADTIRRLIEIGLKAKR